MLDFAKKTEIRMYSYFGRTIISSNGPESNLLVLESVATVAGRIGLSVSMRDLRVQHILADE